MPFIVDDFLDLLRLLEQHPEWRTELRRQVLSDEFLELPALVRQLTEAQLGTEQRLSELAAAQSHTEHRLSELAAAQSRTEQRLSELAAAQSSTEQRLEALVQQISSLVGKVGAIEGQLFEITYRNKYAGRLMRVALGLRLLDQHELGALLNNAVRRGVLSEEEMHSVLNADLVLTGRSRADDVEIYLAVEVSLGLGLDDVQRASERAQLLERLGKPALGVVTGQWINSEAEKMARDIGVWQALNGSVTRPDKSA